MVRLVDHHDLEPLPGALIDLLCLCYFFQKVLDHNSIIVADVARCDFEVVDRGYDVEFQFAARRRLEDARVDLDLLDAGSEKFFEGGHYSRLFASAGWAIY